MKRRVRALCLSVSAISLCLAASPRVGAEAGGSPLTEARAAYKTRHVPAQALKALALFEKAIAADPSYEALWEGARTASYVGQNPLGKASRSKRQEVFKKGLDWAERATKVRPNGAEGHFYVAVLTGLHAQERTFLHQMASARSIRLAAERAYKLDPSVECGGPPRLLGLYYRHLPTAFGGDNDQSRRYLEEAIKHCPDDPSLHYALAECLHKLGQDKRARAEAQRVLDFTPKKNPIDQREYREAKRETEELLRDMD